MGRRAGKLKVEFIENQKSRILGFKRRKECVMKKIKELSTLCDVNSCMILYALDQDAPTAPATVWPPNEPALMRRLVHQFRAKDSKNDDDDDAQFGVCLQKKAQFVRAQIDELKKQSEFMDDAEHQFGGMMNTIDLDTSSTALMMMMMPHGPLMMDEYDDQFGPDVDHSSLYQEEEEDASSTALMMPRSPLVVDDDDDELMRQIELLMGNSSSSSSPLFAQQQQQQQYHLFDSSSSPMYQETDSSTAMMMMMDDTITADQSCCSSSGMAGFDDGQEQDEGASCSRQTAGGDDDVVAVQDNFYDHDDYNFIDQLYTPPRPPMMTWQSTGDDLVFTQFQDMGAIDFDDLWA